MWRLRSRARALGRLPGPEARFGPVTAGCLALVLALAACRGAGAPPAVAPPAASVTPAAASATTTVETAARVAPPGPATASTSTTGWIAPAAAPPTAGSTKVTSKNDPAWAFCHQGYEARRKDVSRDVQAMASACAKATKMTRIGTTLTGKQGDQDPPQTFPLKVEANHCYRVYAQASEGIKDLDLAIKDSAGAIAGEDSTDDPSPVILEGGAVCFTEADGAAIVVSVGLGKGTYAVEVWKD